MGLWLGGRDVASERAAGQDDGGGMPNFIFYTVNTYFDHPSSSSPLGGVRSGRRPSIGCADDSQMVTDLRVSGIF